jgi:hypothetical protein
MGRRVKAWEIAHGTSIADRPIYFSTCATLLDQAPALQEVVMSIDALVESAGVQPALIVVDTKSRHTGGKENDNDDGAKFVSSLDTLRLRYECCVLTIHHSGTSEDSKGRPRGASAVPAGQDHMYQVVRKDDIVTMKCKKMKDGREPEDQIFKLTEVELPPEWTEPGSAPATSAVLLSSADAAEQSDRTAVQQAMLRARVLGQLTRHGELILDGTDFKLPRAVALDTSDMPPAIGSAA